MNAKEHSELAYKALLESIAHWERMRDNEPGEEVPNADNCALCKLFLYHIDGVCSQCPIYEETGEPGCDGSPFFEARDAFRVYERKETPPTKQNWVTAANKEIDFLKSLLKHYKT